MSYIPIDNLYSSRTYEDCRRKIEAIKDLPVCEKQQEIRKITNEMDKITERNIDWMNEDKLAPPEREYLGRLLDYYA